MTFTKDPFHVTEFDLSGFLKLSNDYVKHKKEGYFLQQNQVLFSVKWFISLDLTIGKMELKAIYEPKSKLDFSILATYKANQIFHFKELNNQENKEDIFKGVINEVTEDLATNYNERIKGTKIQIPFPTPNQQTIPQFHQYLLSCLDSSIEEVLNFLK